jgi:hypothetical protein
MFRFAILTSTRRGDTLGAEPGEIRSTRRPCGPQSPARRGNGNAISNPKDPGNAKPFPMLDREDCDTIKLARASLLSAKQAVVLGENVRKAAVVTIK